MAKLLSLHLENFANLGYLDLEFGGKDGKIVGQNRIGKTTVLNAICYLLTDKLLGGSADIPSIKPRDNTRAKVVVEGMFSTPESGVITLRKEFYEKWARPRGSATEELQGHATDYYINGAKQSRVKDFFDGLQEKFGIPNNLNGMDTYQLVLDPFYLGETVCSSKDWKSARKTVIEIVGDVTPEEIYEANPNAEIAKADLERHQFDDAEAKKAIRGEIDGYKKSLLANEGLINEYTMVHNADVSDEEYETAKEEDERINEQIAKLKLGNDSPYESEIAALNKESYELQKQFHEAATSKVDHTESERIRKELYEARYALSNLELEERSIKFECERIKREAQEKRDNQLGYKTKIQELQGQYDYIVVEDTCPTCGQPLPADKVAEAFNIKKAEITAEVERIRGLAVENKKSIEFLISTLETISQRDFPKEISELKERIADIEKALAKAVEDEKAQLKEPDPAISARLEEIGKRLGEIMRLKSEGATGIASQIEALKARKAELQLTFNLRLSAENARKRIGEIKRENIAIGKKQADAEQRYWAVGEFVKTKLELLDEHMARKFGEVRFQLIKENIKAGSYDEVCVPYIIDPISRLHTEVLFPDGSKSEQIFTGLQIIKAIRDAKGWNPLPILFDQGGELDAKSTQIAAYFAEAQILEVKVEGNSAVPTFVPFANN